MINLAFKFLLIGHVRHLGISTTAHCSQDSVEATIRRVVDNPVSLIILFNRGDTGIEFCAFLQAVTFPQLSNLRHNLLTVGITGAPLDGGMKTIHDAMNLKT